MYRYLRQFLVWVSVLASCFTVRGQFSETIRSGRPGQSIGSYTVGKKVLQFQQGVDYSSLAGTGNPPHSIVVDNVIRYGITEKIELSALIDGQYDYQRFDSASVEKSGLSALHVGFRVHLVDQKGAIPSIGFQARVKVPNISANYGAQQLTPVMVLVAGWHLPKNCGLGTNWILSYGSNDVFPTGKYVLNFSFPVHGKFSGFVENYGQVRKSVFQTRFDAGFAYLVDDNVQLDLSGGYGYNQGVQDYFLSTGISWRILFRTQKQTK